MYIILANSGENRRHMNYELYERYALDLMFFMLEICLNKYGIKSSIVLSPEIRYTIE